MMRWCVLGLVGLVGCAVAPPGSCLATNNGQVTGCFDYTRGLSMAESQSACSQTGSNAMAGTVWVYSASECTTTGRVGRCVIAVSGGRAAFTASFYAPTTITGASAACAMSAGTFSAN